MRRVVRHVLGWTCLVLGVAGLVLPVLQGGILIALGALLLAPDIPLFARLACWVEERFPRLGGAIRTIRDRLRRDGESVPPC
jgi:uncharacterized membrane protein YbaN (DUF454 family)